MKYHCLFAGWTEYRPGERDRSKKEAVRLANSTGFFDAGPVFRLINPAGSPEKGSFSGVKQPGERDRSKKKQSGWQTARAFLLPGRAASRRRHPLPGLLGCGPVYSGSAGRNQGETARRARQSKKEAVRLTISTGFFVAFGFLILILINLQKAATCAWLFAPLKGPVCAKGVHAAPCENSQKWTCHFCEESAGFFVVCTKKCLLVTQRHNL